MRRRELAGEPGRRVTRARPPSRARAFGDSLELVSARHRGARACFFAPDGELRKGLRGRGVELVRSASMASTTTPTRRTSSSGTSAPPAVLLNPATFTGALIVFVVGSLIVKWVWPDSR